ncbi:MAG TPA: hypothetical protein VHG08_16205 [Longimicrobium sp.]|nr:hypothetical protein [Longimicrobium sp.]
MIDLLDEEPRVAAARVGLLALRAALAREGPPPPNRFRLPGIARPLSPETAALELARLPRPTALEGAVEGGVIVVARSGEDWLLGPAPTRPMFERRAGRQPAEYPRLPVCCIGAGEALLVTTAAAEAGVRDYPILPGSHNAGPCSLYLGDYPGTARQAYEAGAVGIIRFHFPRDARSPEAAGDVIVLTRDGSPRRPRVLEHAPAGLPCALCGAPRSEWRETATWKKPWRERRLCSACVAARLVPQALARAAALDEWVDALEPS